MGSGHQKVIPTLPRVSDSEELLTLYLEDTGDDTIPVVATGQKIVIMSCAVWTEEAGSVQVYVGSSKTSANIVGVVRTANAGGAGASYQYPTGWLGGDGDDVKVDVTTTTKVSTFISYFIIGD